MKSKRPQKGDSPNLAADSSNLAGLLREIEQTKREPVSDKPLDPRLLLLRNWQVQRLTRTYQDLLKQPRYQPASNFFINDIYASRDFSQRNYDLRRLHETLSRWIPGTMLRPFSLAVQLHELTEQLDLQLLEVLVKRLHLKETLTETMYAEAYRRCDNYAVRVRQIDLIGEIGSGVETLVNIPFSANVLRLGRGPATRAGWGELMIFLERGYAAFKHMHGAAEFLKTIQVRERRILDRIYAKDSDPFGFGQK